jgi:hypothetical protein
MMTAQNANGATANSMTKLLKDTYLPVNKNSKLLRWRWRVTQQQPKPGRLRWEASSGECTDMFINELNGRYPKYKLLM